MNASLLSSLDSFVFSLFSYVSLMFLNICILGYLSDGGVLAELYRTG